MPMRVGTHEVDTHSTPFIIAELGVNHDGSVERACSLVEAAKTARADAIKLQYFQAKRLLSSAAYLADYQRDCGAADPFAMLGRLELSVRDMHRIVAHARSLDLSCIVTVYCPEHVHDMRSIAWDAYKVASPDIVHRPLLEALASTGHPLLVSTGAATCMEVARAANWLAGAEVAFLQCVSAYPTPIEAASLGAIRDLWQIVRRPVGYSDHTTAIETGALAIAAGACFLEKHLTHGRDATGPDHAASLDPNQFREYVQRAHAAHAMMGEGMKRRLDIEQDVAQTSRQSIVTTRALPAGHVIQDGDVTSKRPGTGLEPWRLHEILGKRTSRALGADLPLAASDLEVHGCSSAEAANASAGGCSAKREAAA
jgi:sialic acid synthase SpsE